MNLKKCKALRRMARRMEFSLHEQGIDTKRKLLVLQSHEARAKQGDRRITAVNNPNSLRGIYRWLKKNGINPKQYARAA